jgi:hypothetical protein
VPGCKVHAAAAFLSAMLCLVLYFYFQSVAQVQDCVEYSSACSVTSAQHTEHMVLQSR